MINKIIVQSINNPLKLYNWIKLLNCSAKFCTVQNSKNFVKEYKKLENQTDILRGYAENVTNPIQRNDENIQNIELSKYMDEIHLLANEKIDYDNLKDSKKFIEMCKMIQKNARSLSTYDIIKVLRFLFTLNTPNDTILIVTLLQLLKCYINHLTISQIIASYHMLQTQNETELIKVLLKALKVVFFNQIQVELDASNLSSVMGALKFAHKIKDTSSIKYIINILPKSKEKIFIHDAISIFHTLSYEPQLHRSNKNLLIKVIKVIIDNHESLEYHTIKCLLYQIHTILTAKTMKDIYFEHLINVLCTAVMNKPVEAFHKDIEILKILNMMQYSNKLFIDYITKKCIEDPKLIVNCLPDTILNIVESMNISSYKTKYWDTIEPLILKYTMNINCVFSYTIAITFHLLSLGIYNKHLLDHVFTLYNNKYNINDKNIMHYILQMYQYVKTLYPEYQGIMLGQDTVDYIIKNTEKTKSFTLKSDLEEIVGGIEYIKHHMKTKLNHIIDHVIILQPNSSPLAVNNYEHNEYVEDIAVPIECRRIFILAMPVSLSCRYTHEDQSTWRTTIASLKAFTECNIVSINLRKWFTMNEGNRKLYLRESLKPFDIKR